MKIRILHLVCFVTAAAVCVSAQIKSLTNSELEKYKEKRVAAERDLRENYARLGFSSPEELERRSAQSAAKLSELSARLSAESQERISFQTEQRAKALSDRSYYRSAPENYNELYFWFDGRRYRRTYRRPPYQQPGYFAGGQFWPSGSRTPPQPIVRWAPRR